MFRVRYPRSVPASSNTVPASGNGLPPHLSNWFRSNLVSDILKLSLEESSEPQTRSDFSQFQIRVCSNGGLRKVNIKPENFLCLHLALWLEWWRFSRLNFIRSFFSMLNARRIRLEPVEQHYSSQFAFSRLQQTFFPPLVIEIALNWKPSDSGSSIQYPTSSIQHSRS